MTRRSDISEDLAHDLAVESAELAAALDYANHTAPAAEISRSAWALPAGLIAVNDTPTPTSVDRADLVLATLDAIADTLHNDSAAVYRAIANAANEDASAADHQFPKATDELRYAAMRARNALDAIVAAAEIAVEDWFAAREVTTVDQ